MPIALIASGVAELGLPLLKQLLGSGKLEKWFDIIEQAVAGIPKAIAAVKKLEDWQSSGYTPSNAELDALLDESTDLHDRIQAG